jgi:hypothetical protein
MARKLKLSLAARTFAVELGVFLRVCESVGTVRALTCYLLAESGEWDQYLELDKPDTESRTFADDYLVSEAMRKNPNLTTTANPRKAAIEAWWTAENQCRETNDRLVSYNQGGVSPLDRRTNEVILRAQRIISDVLGPLNRAKLDYMESNMRYGPGATSSCSGPDVVASKKYSCEMHVSPRLYPYYRSLIPRSASTVTLRGYSKVTFVPKTAKTDRAIAIEPHLNIYVQLGIGALLRQRMKRYGINLDHQADINRKLAGIAHKAGLATVDLSSASDTIAYQLIWLLLPFEWACLVDLARTEYSEIDGQEVRLSKFSSMGNGYTFELESLIFLAIARACGDNEAVSFGDDIIIKRDCFPLLKTTLDFLGFTVNSKKSFLAGRFFESCGYDFLDGIMVRPFYFKGDYNEFHTGCIRIANKIRRYSHMRNGYDGCDIRFIRVWHYARRASSRASTTYLPEGFGDDGIICNFDEARPAQARHGHEGYIARVIRQRVVIIKSHTSVGALMHALHRGAFEQEKSVEMTRQFKDTCSRHQVVPFWYNLGEWK